MLIYLVPDDIKLQVVHVVFQSSQPMLYQLWPNKQTILQDKLNQLDGNAINAQQQVEIEQSANEELLEDNMHNARQQPEQLANETQSGASGDTNGNPSASQVQEMEINYWGHFPYTPVNFRLIWFSLTLSARARQFYFTK